MLKNFVGIYDGKKSCEILKNFYGVISNLKVSLLFYHISSVIDFSSEKYICSRGHKDS